MNDSNKIIIQVRFTNSIEELTAIQNDLAKFVPTVDKFELEGVHWFELNQRTNFFFLEEDKIYSLKSFLEFVGFRYISFKRNFKDFYDTVIFINKDIEFKKALEDEILICYSKDDILDKINERGVNYLTPLDKYILRK